MPFRKILPLALVLSAVLAAPAGATYRVGIGDQSATMFDSPAFQKLQLKRVRFLVPWDWYKNAGQKGEVDGFMTRARQANADVLVHFTARRGCFGRSGRYSRSSACRAPSLKAYRASVRRFQRAFPFVRTYGAWNEGNHVSQPTARNPRRAAQYFLTLRSTCKRCTIVAADVLDVNNMRSWLRTFLRYSKGRAKIFGLHNYQDVNRRSSSGTRELLATAPGQVWLTETGGILTFLPSFKRSEPRQASRTANMFKLADRYDTRRPGLRSKITRLYNYQWTGAPVGARFDAGLVNPDGSPRAALDTFARHAAQLPK